VIITRDLVNQYRRTVVVVPLSSAGEAHPPIRVAVNCNGTPAVAVVDQIRAIAKERLQGRIGVLAQPEMEALGHALQQILDLI
jgi:mRNA interferase MazF